MSHLKHTAIGIGYAILFGALSALAVAAAVVVTGCKPGWNDVVIPKPTADEPCGYRWHSCGIREDGQHGCCFEDSVCRPGGYCAFVGYGAAPDAGEVLRQQVSPELAREAGGGR